MLPTMDKLPNNQIIIYINKIRPLFHPQGYQMQKIETHFKVIPMIF